MEDTIKIKCPFCGCILIVKNQHDIESKFVTCPNCKRKSAFTNYKTILAPSEDHTIYPQQNDGLKGKSCSENTQFCSGENLIVGCVIVNGKSVRLKVGKNIIGRKAVQSAATIQIPNESKRMSREHLMIEVRRVPGKGFVHYASLCKERTNDTFIGNDRLEYGDCVILCDGDVIKLPDASLRFEMDDSEDHTLF